MYLYSLGPCRIGLFIMNCEGLYRTDQGFCRSIQTTADYMSVGMIVDDPGWSMGPAELQ